MHSSGWLLDTLSRGRHSASPGVRSGRFAGGAPAFLNRRRTAIYFRVPTPASACLSKNGARGCEPLRIKGL